MSARYPFWDRELLTFCLSLQSSEKLDGGFSRAILRKALAELPPSVRWRRDKLDFTPHLALGLAETRRVYLQGVVDLPSNHELWTFFDREAVRACWFNLLRRREKTFGPNVRALWRVGALAAWLGEPAGRSNAGGLTELIH